METQPVKKGWFARHWMWVVPVGCLLPVLVCGGLVTTIVVVALGAIKNTDVYTTALDTARNHPQVQAALGTPIDDGFMPQGNINTSGPSGSADLSIPLSGPLASGTLYVSAEMVAGAWQFELLELAIEGQPDRINLLTPEQ